MPRHYCSISAYLDENYPQLSDILRQHCLSSIVGPKKDAMKTFLIPTDASIKALTNSKTGLSGSISEAEYEKLVNTILAHVLTEYIPSLSDFSKKPVRNMLYRHLSFGPNKGGKVEGEGITIEEVKDFHPANRKGSPRKLAVYRIVKGELTDTSGSEVKESTGSNDGGCGCGGNRDMYDGSDENTRRMIRDQVENKVRDYIQGKSKSNVSPYDACIAGLYKRVCQENSNLSDNAKTSLTCSISTSTISTFYALLAIGDDQLINIWQGCCLMKDQKSTLNNLANSVKSEDNKQHMAAVSKYFKELDNTPKNELVNKILQCYQSYYGGEGQNELCSGMTWQDKLRLDRWKFHTAGINCNAFKSIAEFNNFKMIYADPLINRATPDLLDSAFVNSLSNSSKLEIEIIAFTKCPQFFLGCYLNPNFVSKNSRLFCNISGDCTDISKPFMAVGSDDYTDGAYTPFVGAYETAIANGLI